MYLPQEILNAEVLVTVKTYPRPTPSHEEIVCTAGVTSEGKWIRIYPIPFRNLPFAQQFPKYAWINLNLTKRKTDFRAESYQPAQMYDEEIVSLYRIGTTNSWQERKRLVLNEVFVSMQEIIDLAYSEERRSLATIKPQEIIGFDIEEDKERDWPQVFTNRLNQMNLFDAAREDNQPREIVKKMPYRYFYRFITEGDNRPRRLSIFDWEIGALFWNSLKITEGDETAANELVKEKYYNQFLEEKDLHFFLGTTYTHHKRNFPNPFIITGVFYPPQTQQIEMNI